MMDMRSLYEALDTANKAVKSGCDVTTRAYLVIARQRLLKAINALQGRERDYADSAYAYVIDQCRACTRPTQEVGLLWAFWQGFEDGWEEATWNDSPDPIYTAGYDFGMYGALQPYDDDESELELDLDLDDDSG